MGLRGLGKIILHKSEAKKVIDVVQHKQRDQADSDSSWGEHTLHCSLIKWEEYESLVHIALINSMFKTTTTRRV